MPELTPIEIAETMRMLQVILDQLDQLGLAEIARHVSLSLDQFEELYAWPS